MGRTQTDLTGQRFGRWTVIHPHSYAKGNHRWLCQCACGRKRLVFYNALTTGQSQSCGCLRKEIVQKRFLDAGKKCSQYPQEYRIWLTMKTRCYNPKNPAYQQYGAKGITMCNKWRESFESFLEDVGPVQGLTLERLDTTKGFDPGNCQWSGHRKQDTAATSTNRRPRVEFLWRDQPRNLSEIARMEDVDYASLYVRIHQKGYTLEEAVNYCHARGLKHKERSTKAQHLAKMQTM